MADIKAKFVPGTQIQELITGCIYLYVEAAETIKNGEEVEVNLKLGRVKHQSEVPGVYIPFGKAAENIPGGQFGLVLIRGVMADFKTAMAERARAILGSGKIDLGHKR